MRVYIADEFYCIYKLGLVEHKSAKSRMVNEVKSIFEIYIGEIHVIL